MKVKQGTFTIVKFLDRVSGFLGHLGDKRIVISILGTIVLFGTAFAFLITKNALLENKKYLMSRKALITGINGQAGKATS